MPCLAIALPVVSGRARLLISKIACTIMAKLLRAVLDETARVSGVDVFRVDPGVDPGVDSTYAVHVTTGGQVACAPGQWRVSPPLAECYSEVDTGAWRVLGALLPRPGEPGNETAKAAVKDAMMCGTSQDVLGLARRTREQAVSARAGHSHGQPAGRLVGVEMSAGQVGW